MKILNVEIISKKRSTEIFYGVITFLYSFVMFVFFSSLLAVIATTFNLNVDWFFGTGITMSIAGVLIPVVSLAVATWITSKDLLKNSFFKGNKKRILITNTISFVVVFFGLFFLMYNPDPNYGVMPDLIGYSSIVIFAAVEYFVLSKFFLRNHS